MKSVFITGVTSGIGQAVFRECYKQQWKITVVVRDKKQQSFFAASFPKVRCLVADLRQRKQVTFVAKKIEKKSFDYIILNAGYGDIGKFHKMGRESIEHVVETNLVSNMILTHALLPRAIKNKSKFVYISSLSAHILGKRYASYAASKAGLSHFSQLMALENPEIKVVCIEPGPVKTRFHPKVGIDDNKWYFKSSSKIGKKIFTAMQTKTGTLTLEPEWYIARKVALLLKDVAMPLYRAARKDTH